MSPRARGVASGRGQAIVPMRRSAGSATWRRMLASIAALAAFLLHAVSVDAHAVLVRSTPAARATVATAPDRVILWFNERLEPAYSSASVWNAAAAQVDRKDARVEGDDPKRLAVTLTRLAPGTYTVRYRVLSVDGHIVESTFPFTVRPPAPR
jgi:methionine-rich copper-binding protein CopC